MASSSNEHVTPSQTKRSPRGCTELASLKQKGKINVKWDQKGRPINTEGGVELATYIGLATRRHFKITDSYWCDKSLGDKKQLIWEDLNVSFCFSILCFFFCMHDFVSLFLTFCFEISVLYMNICLYVVFCRIVLFLLKNANVILLEDAVKLSDNTEPMLGS